MNISDKFSALEYQFIQNKIYYDGQKKKPQYRIREYESLKEFADFLNRGLKNDCKYTRIKAGIKTKIRKCFNKEQNKQNSENYLLKANRFID